MIKKFASFIAALLLVACSGNPSSSDAEKILLERLKKSESSAELKSFKAAKAYSKEIMGTQIYLVEYEAEIAYPNGAACNPNSPMCLKIPGHKEVPAGEVIKKSGKLEFQKTSEGWKGPDGNFY